MRHHSLSDRIRYDWTRLEAETAEERLVAALKGRHVPRLLLWQHLPSAAHLADRPFDVKVVVPHHVADRLNAYLAACRPAG